MFFAIEFSSIAFITSSETLQKRRAAVFKVSAPVIITFREVIIAIYDAILDQSGRAYFFNHLSNYTNID